MLTRYQNIFLAQLCVHKTIDVMQVEKSLTIDMAKACAIEDVLVDWLVSVSYMFAKLEIQLLPRLGGVGKRKSDRKIFKFESNRGRGGGR